MGLVRTNVTLPEETLALVDAVAGPRGRSRYIAEVVFRQVRRDNARMVFEKYAGAFKNSTTWGTTDEEVLENLRQLRDSSERDRMLWAPYETEELDALPAGYDRPDRSQPRRAKRTRTRTAAVQRAE